MAVGAAALWHFEAETEVATEADEGQGMEGQTIHALLRRPQVAEWATAVAEWGCCCLDHCGWGDLAAALLRILPLIPFFRVLIALLQQLPPPDSTRQWTGGSYNNAAARGITFWRASSLSFCFFFSSICRRNSSFRRIAG